jgi:hypothetical protein
MVSALCARPVNSGVRLLQLSAGGNLKLEINLAPGGADF